MSEEKTKRPTVGPQGGTGVPPKGRNGQLPSKRRYSKKRKEMLVEIEQEDGSIREYWLREMMGPALSEWTDLQSSRMQFDRNGAPTGLRPIPNLHAKLISLGLYDRDGNLVPEAEIVATFPASTQRGLYQDAQMMNGLDDEAREKEKNA